MYDHLDHCGIVLKEVQSSQARTVEYCCGDKITFFENNSSHVFDHSQSCHFALAHDFLWLLCRSRFPRGIRIIAALVIHPFSALHHVT